MLRGIHHFISLVLMAAVFIQANVGLALSPPQVEAVPTWHGRLPSWASDPQYGRILTTDHQQAAPQLRNASPLEQFTHLAPQVPEDLWDVLADMVYDNAPTYLTEDYPLPPAQPQLDTPQTQHALFLPLITQPALQVWGNKPVFDLLVPNPSVLISELAFTAGEVAVVTAVSESERAAIASLDAEAAVYINDDALSLDQKRAAIAEMDYNGRLRVILQQSNATLQAQLPAAQYSALTQWVEQAFQAQRQNIDAMRVQLQVRAPATPDQCTEAVVYATTSTYTDNSVDLPDQYLKAANRGWSFQPGYENPPYTVNLAYNGVITSSIIITDVAPWNHNDNYWRLPDDPIQPRRAFTDLPLGKPQAEAAYFDGYNGGLNEFGQIVGNPAGINISQPVAAYLGFPGGYQPVTVTYDWDCDGPSRYNRTFGLDTFTAYTAQTVNPVTGNQFYWFRDFLIKGKGLNVDMPRYYNGQNRESGIFGYGWSTIYDMYLRLYANGVVEVRYADGRKGYFTPDGLGGYVAEPGVFELLTTTSDGFTLETIDKVYYDFDATGRLLFLHDNNTNQIALNYTGDQLSSLTDTTGRSVVFSYTGGFVSQITDPMGRVYNYTYSGNKLTGFTDPNSGTTVYAYDPVGGWLTSVTDASGVTYIQNSYDENGRIISQMDAVAIQQHRRGMTAAETTFEYDVANNRSIQTDANGNKTYYYYDSEFRLVREEDALGNATTYTYDDNDNMMSMTDKRGNTWHYTYDDRGNMITKEDPIDANSALYYDTDITTYEYDENNNRVRTVDALGNETLYEYDANDNVTKITEPNGAETISVYDDSGQMLSLTDALGRVTTYEYDSDGNRTKITDALGNETTFTYDDAGNMLSRTDAEGRVTHYEYDGNNNMTKMTDALGHETIFEYNENNWRTRMTDRRGFVWEWEYDDNGNVILERDPLGREITHTYDDMNHRLSTTNARGFTTTYTYDAVYNLLTIRDAAGNVTTNTYDANGNLLSITDATNTTVLQIVYDSNNRRKYVYDGLGGVTEYCYDPLDRMIRMFDPRRAKTDFVYDDVGNLIEIHDPLAFVTAFTYDLAHNRTAVTDQNGYTTTTIYDALNREIEIINPLGFSVHTAYDRVSNVVSVTDAMGYVTTFQYNDNNQLILETNPLTAQTSYDYDEVGNLLSVTDANGQTYSNTYNEAGLLVSSTDPLGSTYETEYDANSNVALERDPYGREVSYEYNEIDLMVRETDALNHGTTYIYDAIRRPIQVIDALGNSTSFAYDTLGHLVSVTDARGQATTYEYDAVGNRTAIVDANGHRTEFKYNFLNQLREELNALGDKWMYGYGPAGNMVLRVDANWHATAYRYDAGYRLTSTIYGSSGKRVDYTYDANGNELTMTDWNGTFTTNYDELNRPVSNTDHNGRTLTHNYDPVGNRTNMVYPDGRSLQMQYDANNRLATLTDPHGRDTNWTYNDLNLITNRTNPNGTSIHYQFDAANRLIRLSNHGSTAMIAEYDFMLDAVGNRTMVVENRTSWNMTQVNSYGYDELYRLTDVTSMEGVDLDYLYDPVGNRLQMQGVPEQLPGLPLPEPVNITYIHNEINSLLEAGDTNFDYDLNGSRTRQVIPLEATEYITAAYSIGIYTATVTTDYVYDYENRLNQVSTYISATNGTTLTLPVMQATYDYDGYGRRIAKHVTTSITGTTVLTTPTTLHREYVFDGIETIVEYETWENNTGPDVVNHYYYGNGGLLMLDHTEDSDPVQTLWYHMDGLGSTIALSDESGQVVDEIEYDSYGNLLTPDSDFTLNRYSFSGEEWDPETQLVHYFSRYYDPAIGVWISQDSFRGLGESPSTLNRYAYVLNNPVNNIDFYGYGLWDDLVQGTKKVGNAVKDKVNDAKDWVDNNVYKPYVKPAVEETKQVYEEHVKPIVNNINGKYVQPIIKEVKGEIEEFKSNPRGYVENKIIEPAKAKLEEAKQLTESAINWLDEKAHDAADWIQEHKALTAAVVGFTAGVIAGGAFCILTAGAGCAILGAMAVGALAGGFAAAGTQMFANSYDRELDGQETHLFDYVPQAFGIGGGAGAIGGGSAAVAFNAITGAPQTLTGKPIRFDSARVLNRAKEAGDTFHNFPRMLDKYIYEGTRTVISNKYVQYTIQGSMAAGKSGKVVNGVYEIGVKPILGGMIEIVKHRFFNPG